LPPTARTRILELEHKIREEFIAILIPLLESLTVVFDKAFVGKVEGLVYLRELAIWYWDEGYGRLDSALVASGLLCTSSPLNSPNLTCLTLFYWRCLEMDWVHEEFFSAPEKATNLRSITILRRLGILRRVPDRTTPSFAGS